MKLFKLLNKAMVENTYKKNIKINSIKCDSRLIQKNDVFICIKGINYDGHDYIKEAIDKGASVIISEFEIKDKIDNVYYYVVKSTKKTYARLLEIEYRKYTKNVNIIGVTGTNGKTTITTLLHNYFKQNNISSMLVGTSGVYYNNKKDDTKNTTPNIDILYRYIKKCSVHKIKYLIMEVSSIAISELRVYGISFNQLVMTNLTVDHLDYHKNITDYLYTKSIIFSKIKRNKKNFVLLNKDDISYNLFNNLTECKVYTYSLNNGDIIANNIDVKKDNMIFDITISNKNYNFNSNLIGEFNVYNIMAIIGVLYNLGNSIKSIQRFIGNFKNVPGRMELFTKNDKTIIVDYAHTPDGVLSVIKTVKKMPFNKIWVVIGCGGNRDRSKRKLIGEVLNKYADHIILTNDNPRFEDEMTIIKEIEEGINIPHLVILDRYKAILEAFNNADKDDCIMVLGKGIEENQIKGNLVIKYSDIESVKDIIGG